MTAQGARRAPLNILVVDLRHYRSELLAYKLPAAVSAPLMKRMFSNSLLTRRIMTLHGNTDDLMNPEGAFKRLLPRAWPPTLTPPRRRLSPVRGGS